MADQSDLKHEEWGPSWTPDQKLVQALDPWSSPSIEPAFLGPVAATGDLILLVGAPRSGKTHSSGSITLGFLNEKLAAVTLGGALAPNLGEFGDGTVAIVDGENDLFRSNGMLRRYLEGAGFTKESYDRRVLRVHPSVLRVGVPKPKEAYIREGVRSLTELGVRFLAVDSMLAVFRPDDINSSAWAIAKLQPFREACKEFGVTAMILTHPARGVPDQKSSPHLPLGTVAQEAIADTIIHQQLLGAKHRDGIRLTLVKSRRATWLRPEHSMDVYFSGHGHYECKNPRDAWPAEPQDPDAVTQTLTEKQQDVLRKLSAYGATGVTAKALAKELGSSADAVGDHLRALANKGLAERCGGARNTRWHAVEEGEGR